MKVNKNLRIEDALISELEEEAKDDGRKFSGYVEKLLKTHPNRPYKIVGNIKIRKKDFKVD
jgi:hypothetical protein